MASSQVAPAPAPANNSKQHPSRDHQNTSENMATVQQRSHAQDVPMSGPPPPMDVDPMLASGSFNAGIKRRLEEPTGDARSAPAPRLSMAQDGPQAFTSANVHANANNHAHGPAPPHQQGPPHIIAHAGPPPGNPNYTPSQSPKTPIQRPGSGPGMHTAMSTPVSEGGRPLQIESSGRKVTIACENCRARKTRCDGGIPCARCVRSNTECLYDTERRRRGPHAGSRRTKTGPYSLEDFLESNVKRAAAESSATKGNRQSKQYPDDSSPVAYAQPPGALPLPPGALPPPSPTKSVRSAKGVTSNSENEGMPSTSTSKKVTFACQGCRQRKTRCDGSQPCASCSRLKADCTYDTERKRRGPRVGYRRGGKAEAVAAAIVLTSQPTAMNPYSAKPQNPKVDTVIWAQPEELRPLSPEPPPAQFVPGPSLANLVDAHQTRQPPPPMPPNLIDQVNRSEEKELEDELQGDSDYEGDESYDEGGPADGPPLEPGETPSVGDDRPRRTVGSCAMCRVRKVKCDRVHPQCSSCAQHGQTCRYEMPPKRRKRPLVEDPNPGAPPPAGPPGMQIPGHAGEEEEVRNMTEWVANENGVLDHGPGGVSAGPPLPPPGMLPLPPPPGHAGAAAPSGPVGSPPLPTQ